MKKVQIVSVAVFGLMFAGGPAAATTLTFDDISSAAVGTIPDGYGGLNWDNVGFYDGSDFANSGYENGRVSGTHVAFNVNAFTATVSGPTFDFNSAYLTAAWNNDLNITVTGLSGGTELYSQTVIVDPFGPTLFNFNFIGIDQLTFASFGGTNAGLETFGTGEHFVMDDFTFNRSAGVPDGGSALALFGLGMIGLSTLRRKLS
jgi:hypothetical protein